MLCHINNKIIRRTLMIIVLPLVTLMSLASPESEDVLNLKDNFIYCWYGKS